MRPKPEWELLAQIAEEDFQAFLALVPAEVSLPIVCFHGQQAIEKYMKAVLSKKRIAFPFTHDLIKLYHLMIKNNLEMPISMESLEKLNPFAVKQRYDRPPEIYITREEAQDIVANGTNWCKKQLHG